MGISIVDLSTDPIFQNEFPLVAGFKGLNNEISYISVIDTPLIPAPSYKFESGVFVLSSFFLYKDDPDLLLSAFKNLAAAGASAIGVKTDLFLGGIPESVIAYCNEANLPLFAANNKNLPFRKIISVVESIINQNKTNTSFYAGLLQPDLQSVFYSIAKDSFNLNIVCVTTGMETIIKYTPNALPSCETLEAEAKRYLAHASSTKAFLPSGGYDISGSFYIFPCHVYNKLEAILVFEYPASLSPLKISKVQQLVALLSLQIKEKILIDIGKKDAMVNQSKEYLLKQYESESAARESFESIGFPVGVNYRLLLIKRNVEDKLSDSYLSSHKHDQNICEHLSLLFPKSIFFDVHSHIVFILPIPASSKYCSNNSVVKALETLFDENDPTFAYYIKITQLQHRLSDIPVIYNHLMQVSKFGHVIRDQEPLIELVRDFDCLSIFSSVKSSNQSSLIYRNVIEPIRQYDKQYNSELWHTVEECIKKDKLELAAETLHIHSSTLRYRLQKIENLTGCSFFNTKDKLVLFTACILQASEAPNSDN